MSSVAKPERREARQLASRDQSRLWLLLPLSSEVIEKWSDGGFRQADIRVLLTQTTFGRRTKVKGDVIRVRISAVAIYFCRRH